jgi:GT2 family glycosyltransferase/glycosyltransferase involved in cell wall biosynthesis
MPTAGGAIVLAISGSVPPTVHFRDSRGNLHNGRIVDRLPFQSPGGAAIRLTVQPPRELIEGAPSAIDVVLRAPDVQTVFQSVFAASRATIHVRSFLFENSCASFAGECSGGTPRPFSLGLFVDGDLSASCTIAPEARSFAGRIVLAHTHLDGRAHVLELREVPEMALVASAYQVLPLHITPWSALQSYAGPPLDGTLSHQARHHLHAYRLWFERLRSTGVADLPPLDQLHGELLQGFRKRPAYPQLRFANPDRPIVSVVIPVHNKCEVTYHCLCSLLFAYNDTPFEVIVVDDGSSDETASLAEFVDGVKIVRHARSQGFVRACNEGASRAAGEFVLLLNNDTEVTARWIDELVAVFRNFDGVGLAGSKLVYPDGRLQEAGGVIWGSGNPWNVGRDGNPGDPRYDYLRKVDYVSGAALIIPRELWQELGGFSEEFAPGYFEDTDLAMKVREKGRFVVYVPKSTVYHFEGQSAGTDVAAGMKSFQDVNRPKFRRKWDHAYRNNGREGIALEREKDRDVAFRVLFIEHQTPFVDSDAGSYAAFQEIRLLQALGAKVSFLPRNLAWMDRHTTALQRIGVECLFAPFVMNFLEYVREHARDYDLVYVTRYKIAEQVIPLVRESAPGTRIVFNLADLHYLRERREAAAGTPGYSRSEAERTRRAELATITAADLTFSYSDAELEILAAEVTRETELARMPWVVDCRPRSTAFRDTRNILFLGGFGHPPNAHAVAFFASRVMPLLRRRLPDATFDVIGSGAQDSISGLASEHVRILGHVPNLAEPLERTRVFVAPLLAGAGLKGKVLDAISHGVPCVLSSIAAEGTGLSHETDCLIAETADQWADCVVRLYTDEELWNRIAASALQLAQTRYSFDGAVPQLERELARIGLTAHKDWGLPFRLARPEQHVISGANERNF